jgi:integrase
LSVRFSTLDRRQIRRLKLGEKISEHGITVERLIDGDLRYSVNVMVDGKRIHRVIGKASEGVTRTQCEEFIERQRTEARSGRLSLPKGRKLPLTFAIAAERYIQRLEESGGKNIRIKRRQLRMYLVDYFGSQRLDAITGFTVGKYKKRRIDQGAANSTINRELAVLSHLFYCAVEWKWLDRVPVRLGKHKLAEGDGRIIALSDEQCDALLRAAIADGNPDLWLFVLFGLNTAMRHDEIMRARWDELDLANRRLFIPNAKGGKREQPITPELAEVLEREREMREDHDGWIFPSPHADTAAGHRTRMDRPFAEAVKGAGLDPALVTPHVTRHTAITNLVRAGVDTPTIQRISGHKSYAMVLKYVHVHGQHIDDGIKAIGRSLPPSVPNEPAEDVRGQKSGTPAEHNYTGITHAAPAAMPERTKKNGNSQKISKRYRLEAGSGIEPLYEDLQSSA